MEQLDAQFATSASRKEREDSVGALANLLRGAIISNFARVEFTFTEIISRCAARPEYQSVLAGALPLLLIEKLAMARLLLSLAGPLAPYKDEVIAKIDALARFEDMRHLMAHGFVAIAQPGERIVFKMYRRVRKRIYTRRMMDFSVDELNIKSIEIENYSKDIVALARQILADEDFAPIPVLERRGDSI